MGYKRGNEGSISQASGRGYLPPTTLGRAAK